jgi:hypothetical protein
MNSESKESFLFINQTSAMLFAQGFQLSKIPRHHPSSTFFFFHFMFIIIYLKLDIDIDNINIFMSMVVDRGK